jgi:hypothetical protein
MKIREAADCGLFSFKNKNQFYLLLYCIRSLMLNAKNLKTVISTDKKIAKKNVYLEIFNKINLAYGGSWINYDTVVGGNCAGNF